ncbi:Yip1-domain-containing protein [Meredithblackwellia eburnea MCA 4105]
MSGFYQSNYGNTAQDPNLQFYSSQPQQQPHQSSSGFYAGRPSLESNSRHQDVAGAIGSGAVGGQVGGHAGVAGGQIVVLNWWNAFTPWTGVEGEPPLLEELGINFDHILQKSLTVLNPLSAVEPHIMDDADLAGPLVFCFVFASLLLLSGKPQFSYIYGVALVGSASIYCLLNLMSESGIDAYRTMSVLGYCLLPLVLLTMVSVIVSLDGSLGYIACSLSIAWCSYSASSIFSSVLRLSSQRFLVAYPVGLLYTAFALLSVFDGKTGGIGVKG